MALSDVFGFFDPDLPYDVTCGSLPHWEQTGATYFITFRLADSIPRSVLHRWEDQRRRWLAEHRISPDTANWQRAFGDLPWTQQYEFFRSAAQFLEKSLDDCHGECLLSRPELANEVASSLRYFDGFALRAENSPASNRPAHRYHIADFIVMPNHVHVLVCFARGVRLKQQCRTWKHYTAVALNRLLGRTGSVWQAESFDHLVRDGEHFERFRRYIAANPRRAHLPEGTWLLHRMEDLQLNARDSRGRER